MPYTGRGTKRGRSLFSHDPVLSFLSSLLSLPSPLLRSFLSSFGSLLSHSLSSISSLLSLRSPFSMKLSCQAFCFRGCSALVWLISRLSVLHLPAILNFIYYIILYYTKNILYYIILSIYYIILRLYYSIPYYTKNILYYANHIP